MVRSKSLQSLLAPLLISLLGYASVQADVTITTPATAGENLSYCSDYFHEEWGVRLSMDDAASGVLNDIPEGQLRFIDNLTYSGGVASFTTGSNSPELTFLSYTVIGSLPIGTRYGQNKPIDSSNYRVLTMRMYSSKNTIGRVRWFHAYDRWALVNFDVYAGWHTYSVDLATATISLSSGSTIGWQQDSPQGLEIFPSNESGVSMALDWVMLTPSLSSCSTYSVNFTATANGNDNLFGLFADTNNSFNDGASYEIYSGTVAGADTKSVQAGQLSPATYFIYGILSGDWATLRLHDPFDMSNSEDVKSDLMSGIGNATFSGGSFSATTTNTDPQFFLGLRNGETIDASTYSFFSMGMNFAFPGGVVGDSITLFFFNSDSSVLVGSKVVPVVAGANTLQFQVTAGDGWSGNIGAIRVDPGNNSGTTFSLDYVAIRQAGYVNSLTTPTPSFATGTLKVNDIQLGLVQPDKNGGLDFGQSQMGNSWNFNAAGDVSPIYNVAQALIYPHNILTDPAGASFTGDFFYATNTPNNGDSNYFSVKENGNIDTSRFVNVCFRGWNKTETLAPYNSVARILWQDPREGNTEGSYKNGDDIVMNRGNQTYCVDMMREIELEPALPAGSPNPWTSISAAGSFVNYFRVDMNENDEGAESAYYSVLDFITLRTDHESNTQYAIVVDASLSQEVNLYATTTRGKTGGTLIGTLAAGRNTNVYKWDTSAVAEGSYYIYATATSNGNTVTHLAEGRVRVNHSLTQDATAPILNCERPSTGQLFDTEIELAGYALDETRLATVEVFLDDVHFSNIQPTLFHLAARDTYPNYSESNNCGFHKMDDATGISYGAHTIKYVAVDTAGNETTCSVAATRQVGATITPITYPDANASPITLEVDGSTASPVLNITTSKANVNFSITGIGACSVVSLQGSSTNDFSSVTEVFRNESSVESLSITSSNIPKFKAAPSSNKRSSRAKKKKDDGKVYFKVVCAPSNSESSAALLSLKRIKNKKVNKTEKGILKILKKKASAE